MGNPEKMAEVRDTMREFYLTVKEEEGNLRFVLLTGLTKITKAGVFSALNNLTELTTRAEFSCFLGCTQEELEQYYSEFIDKAATTLNISRTKLLENIKDFYNGFSFDGVHFVYNPYSVAQFLDECKFKNYWIDSGTSDSLVQYAKRYNLRPEKYLHDYIQDSDLVAYEIEQAPPKNFLVQSGYLTFKGVNARRGYLLDYPNREVKDTVSALMMVCGYDINPDMKHTVSLHLYDALDARNFEMAFDIFKQIFAAIPGKLYSEDESWYHTVLLTFLWGCNLKAKAEEWTANGISDIVLDYDGDIYIIELKKKPPEASLAQIKEKGYAEKYASAPFLLCAGIEINTKRRGLKSFAVITLTKAP
jgi:hypothetical protein